MLRLLERAVISRPVRLPDCPLLPASHLQQPLPATQISIVALLDEPSIAAQSDDSGFLITDDDDESDYIPKLIVTRIGIQPFPFSASYPEVVVTPVPAKRHTVLIL